MSKELEAREKLDYFLVGLCFALLGAAIQTAKFVPNQKTALLLEIGSWLGLIISGYVGITKIKIRSTEWYLFETSNRLDGKLTTLESYAKKLIVGDPNNPANNFEELRNFVQGKANEEVDELKVEYKQLVDLSKGELKRLHSVTAVAFELSFMASMLILASARSLEPIKQMLRVH